MSSAFKFGVELELLLSGRFENEFSDLKQFANHVASCYNRRTGRHDRKIHEDLDGDYKGEDADKEWSLTEDCTVRADRADQWPIEIVSPILVFGTQEWRDDIRKLFTNIRSFCRIECNDSCGLHIHISPPGSSQWSIETLRSLCRSLIYFENGFQVLLPQHRRANYFAASNRYDNPRLNGRSLGDIFEAIDQCELGPDITDLMNDGGKKYFACNFLNLWHGRSMTVEFRQAPGAPREQDCLPWVELIVAFVHAARDLGTPGQLRSFSQDVQGLHRFITRNQPSGMNRTILDSLFRGKTGAIHPRAVPPPTEGERWIIEAKEEEDGRKNMMLKKMGRVLQR